MRIKAKPIPCSHILEPCPIPEYQLCTLCGTYCSTAAAAPSNLYERDYWTHENGRSTISEQTYNVEEHKECGVSKNDYVMRLVEVERGGALDIGCAPGNLLYRMHCKGFSPVFGVDVDRSCKGYIEQSGGDGTHLMFGYFPEVTSEINAGSFNLIVALDLFEHIHDPAPFLLECKRLLKQGGQLILMMPMVGDGEEVSERFFCASEHVFIHSAKHVAMMLEGAGFEKMKFGRWTSGHEVVSARIAD